MNSFNPALFLVLLLSIFLTTSASAASEDTLAILDLQRLEALAAEAETDDSLPSVLNLKQANAHRINDIREQERLYLLREQMKAEQIYDQKKHRTDAHSVGGVAKNITFSIVSISSLIAAISYIAGMAFGLTSLMKFKLHRDNPLNMPLSTPVTEAFMAVILIFLPYFSTMTGVTAFGTAAKSALPGL